MHCAYALCFSYPAERIVASKIDLKLACWRAYVNRLLASMPLLIFSLFALISLCLPFGGTYCSQT